MIPNNTVNLPQLDEICLPVPAKLYAPSEKKAVRGSSALPQRPRRGETPELRASVQ